MVVVGDDLVANVQPQSRAYTYAFGSEERLKDALLDFGWDAGDIVCYLYEHVLLVVIERRTHPELAMPFHCVYGVVNEVSPHLV